MKDWENVIFKFSILTLSTLVGNVYYIILLAIYHEHPYSIPRTWIFINVAILIIIGAVIFNRLKLNIKSILASGVFTFIVFPILWVLLPLKIPQSYIGLRLVDSDGYILSDEYCIGKCKEINNLLNVGYKEERRHYSWRYAELLGRNLSNFECCHYRKFDCDFIYGILLVAEITFEYFPLIFLLTLGIVLFEYYNNKELSAFGKDFMRDGFETRKFVTFSIIIIIIILIYNISYLMPT